MAYRANSQQLAQVYPLMREAGLDLQVLSDMHKPAIEGAGMSFIGWSGERVNIFLAQLSPGQASAYIAALARQVGDA